MKTNKIHFQEINPFDFQIKYINIDSKNPVNVHTSHIHEECEIYVNLSGDVSFLVENRIYPIKPGDIIITRPYEYHHCIYHSNKLHKHFWILFSAEGNEHLLDVFFDRNPGEGNHLVLSPIDSNSLISLCHRMTENETSDAVKYSNFFKLISLLQSADTPDRTEGDYPTDIVEAINYISHNFTHPITIEEIASTCCVSINTLERHFGTFLNTTPSAYIRKKRLANAAKLLSMGCSVTEASEKSGFSNYSAFIALFRKTYGITPLQYSKNVQKNHYHQ